jgi:hypothetical protein
MHIYMYILTAPRHATTMSRLPSTRGGALACRHRHVSNPVGPTLALIFLLLHEQRLANRPGRLRRLPQMFRVAGRVEELGDSVVLRGVGHTEGGE